MEKKPYERKNQLIIKIHEQANIKYFKIQNLLRNIQEIKKMFTQILMVTIQTKSVEYWLYLMICLLISLVMKKLKQIVTEFFICGGKLNIAFAFIKES